MAQPLWTFMEVQTVGGRGVITDWVSRLDFEAEDEFHGILRVLEITPRRLWVRPVYDVMGTDIGEIRFKINKLQHRVFGFFLMDVSQYVMLIGSQKKGSLYDPRDAVKTARKRKKLIDSDRSQLRAYKDHKIQVV